MLDAIGADDVDQPHAGLIRLINDCRCDSDRRCGEGRFPGVRLRPQPARTTVTGWSPAAATRTSENGFVVRGSAWSFHLDLNLDGSCVAHLFGFVPERVAPRDLPRSSRIVYEPSIGELHRRVQPGQIYRVDSNRRARRRGEERVERSTAFRKLTAQRFDEKHFELNGTAIS